MKLTAQRVTRTLLLSYDEINGMLQTEVEEEDSLDDIEQQFFALEALLQNVLSDDSENVDSEGEMASPSVSSEEEEGMYSDVSVPSDFSVDSQSSQEVSSSEWESSMLSSVDTRSRDVCAVGKKVEHVNGGDLPVLVSSSCLEDVSCEASDTSLMRGMMHAAQLSDSEVEE